MLESAWVEPGLGSSLAFVAIVAAVGLMLVAGWRAASRRRGDGEERTRRSTIGAALFVVAVVGLSAGYVASGMPAKGVAPFVAFFAISNLTALGLALSPVGRRFLALPAALLVAPHALRLPLELVLHAWADAGTIPSQMTFDGDNFDIVTGALALALAAYGMRRPLPRAAIWTFNLVGTGLLLTVMTIAVLSSPIPLRAYEGPPLLVAFHLPYALIVPMCVAPALFGHVVLFRWLTAPRSPASSVRAGSHQTGPRGPAARPAA